MPLDRTQTTAPFLFVVLDNVRHSDVSEILPYISCIFHGHRSGYPAIHDVLEYGNGHRPRLQQGYEVVRLNYREETVVWYRLPDRCGIILDRSALLNGQHT